MGQSPFWEANIHSVSLEILRLLWNTKVHVVHTQGLKKNLELTKINEYKSYSHQKATQRIVLNWVHLRRIYFTSVLKKQTTRILHFKYDGKHFYILYSSLHVTSVTIKMGRACSVNGGRWEMRMYIWSDDLKGSNRLGGPSIDENNRLWWE
jgi:hypothetical protein